MFVDCPVAMIVDVPAFNVKLIAVAQEITPPLPVKVTVLAPKLIVLTLVLVESKDPAVTAYPPVVNVPFVTVSALVPMFNASAS